MSTSQFYDLVDNLVEHFPVGLMVWHLANSADVNSFRLLAINPVARQILGIPDTYSAEWLSQNDPFPSFLKIEPPEVYAEIACSQLSRDLGEIRYRNEKAIERIISVKAFPLPPQRIGIMLADITEQKQTEEALRQSERKLLIHLQQTPLAVVEWNLDCNILEWNPSAEKIFGYTRREALGQNLTKLILPEEVTDRMTQFWQKLIQRKSSVSKTRKNITGGGRTIVCEWHNTPLIDDQENVTSVISLIQDVTDREQKEAELKRFASQLEQSNRSLQEFTSIASHDLQEPLRKISAFGDRIYSKYAKNLPPEGIDYLERIQKATQRMQSLIRDLLTFSRLTADNKPFSLVNLHEVVHDVLSDLEFSIHQLNAQIEVDELPAIEADPLQMRQLLQNLLSNALKFHRPDTSPHIQIQAQILSVPPVPFLPPQVCQIHVTDNGIGFNEVHLDRIFNLFQRLHPRQEYEGTGMGLAICRTIVEHHGGNITAHSVPGQGTTFVVTLPISQTR